jgi:hypothetical protein
VNSTAPTASGPPGQDANAHARNYHGLGFLPIPLPRGMKDPGRPGWQNLRPTAEDIDHLFPPGAVLNVGLLLGEPSGGLVDADLDSHEAVRAARSLPSRPCTCRRTT